MPDPIAVPRSPPPSLINGPEPDLTSAPPIPSLGHITPIEVHSALAAVNRGRFKLLTRIANLRLFDAADGSRYSENIRADDHPIVATLLQMRDEFKATTPTDAAGSRLRMDLLKNILAGLEKAIMIGERSAESLSGALQAHAEFEQHKKEHEDKMELLRDKLNGGALTIEQLENMSTEAYPVAPAGSVFDTQGSTTDEQPTAETTTGEAEPRTSVSPPGGDAAP